MTRADPTPRASAPRPAGGGRLPFDLAPALSAVGLVVIGAVSFALLGGSLPTLPVGPGGPGGPGGPIRTPTPSNIVVTPNDPRTDIPGRLLYEKDGNIWVQAGDKATQLTTDGHDSMPAWAPDGSAIYFVRTAAQDGRWPSGDRIRTYRLEVPTLYRMRADGTGTPEELLTGSFRRNTNRWSYFIREPSISPDGSTAAIVTDGPDPTRSDVVVKLLDLESLELADPGLGQTQSLGHQDPAWSPDGRYLMYVRNAREGARGTPAIYRWTRSSDRSSAITGPGYADPSWSRDGRWLAATKTGSFGTNVVILDARSGIEQLVVTKDDSSFNPIWSPMGDAIAFYRVNHGVVDLYMVELEGDAPSWTAKEPLALTISAGLDAASRPAWFVPADQLPPLPTPTPTAVPSAGSPEAPSAAP